MLHLSESLEAVCFDFPVHLVGFEQIFTRKDELDFLAEHIAQNCSRYTPQPIEYARRNLKIMTREEYKSQAGEEAYELYTQMP